jgi:hypothetical protein
MNKLSSLLLLALALPVDAMAQSTPEIPAIAQPRAATEAPAATAAIDPARVGTPAVAPPRAPRRSANRARPRDPRDRAYMDGGIPGSSSFSGFGGPSASTVQRAELAPRPNLDLEGPRRAAPSSAPSIQPTLIHPRLPGRSEVQDGGVTQRENRLLQSPAPGARLRVPMSW